MRHLLTSLLIFLSALSANSAPPTLDTRSKSTTHKRITVENWDDGWTIVILPGVLFLPIETSATFLERFLERTMAAIAASMLNNEPTPEHFHMSYQPLIFDIVPLTTQVDMDWTMMFLLTQYMRNRAARGYTGTGDVIFGHVSGIVFRLTIRLAEGYGASILKPCRDSGC